ncbi:MAG TPA: helix-turn-helix transcriptional regulator [Candidatus Mediterraneibacter tabaqchaliae]|uniref:Helix-turn-helix transcriptional regulator n=1 Tax=Candidatus Mediterraneibacter tabaqchaliae TaxID=2838689 RepID=A0A9D2R310_9FIRM|nr:helix-turn-helix transcriptional regulator [Lachnoclostridium sp. An76]OUN33853.1 transcriptional regulator [Lachnoclostridium sp. An76]HJD34474.1 helix-turn-helix transcriptional regulator [Candidatus Mediterraneibacter tabaqchaliae]
MDQKKIGAFIAQRRKELNMTQKELAEKMNITDRAVSKWETGVSQS